MSLCNIFFLSFLRLNNGLFTHKKKHVVLLFRRVGLKCFLEKKITSLDNVNSILNTKTRKQEILYSLMGSNTLNRCSDDAYGFL